MRNRPEYVAIWLGLSSIGVIVSLINTQLRGLELVHCVDMVAPKHVIVAAKFWEQFCSVTARLASYPKIWLHGGDGGGQIDRIDSVIEEFSGEDEMRSQRRAVTIADPALLIYTSSTTGLPKACYLSHHRLLQWSFWFAGLMNTGPDDRMYDCLPMYHSVGGVVTIGALLVRGGSVSFVKDSLHTGSGMRSVI